MGLDEKIAQSLDIIERARTDNDAVETWAGFSGGHDSVCVAHLLATRADLTGTFHANTLIGVERTREYVRLMSKQHHWNLREIKTDESYDRIVTRIGFPGAAYHRIMYARLKDRPVAQLLRERKVGRKRNARIILATGIRNDESRKRMGYNDAINRVGSLVWVNPLLHWTHADREEYIAGNGLRRNEVADELGMSGECLCGAYASRGELGRVRRVDPCIALRIDGLNAVIIPIHGWGWEEAPPRGHVTPREEMRAVLTKAPLCAACDMRHRHGEDHYAR